MVFYKYLFLLFVWYTKTCDQNPYLIYFRRDRKRVPNFSQEEEQILVNLVEKYKAIIDNKKSGAITWKQKEDAWKKILEEFSKSCFKSISDHKSLKIKYN